jgi:hypothetical protein
MLAPVAQMEQGRRRVRVPALGRCGDRSLRQSQRADRRGQLRQAGRQILAGVSHWATA